VILAGETPDAAHVPTGCRFHPRCPLAEQAGIMARCRAEEPPLIALGGGRASACWLAESGKPLPAVERRVGTLPVVPAGGSLPAGGGVPVVPAGGDGEPA